MFNPIKLTIIFSLLFSLVNAYGQNIELDQTLANCKKASRLNSIGGGVLEQVATTFEVSIASTKHVGTRWQEFPDSCNFVFDTAKGPVECGLLLFSSDNGKTAFAAFGAGAPDMLCRASFDRR